MDDEKETASGEALYWGGLATMGFGVITALVYIFAQIIVTAAAVGLKASGSADADIALMIRELENDGFYFAVSTCVSTLVCAPVILLFVKMRRGASIKEYLRLKPPGVKVCVYWLGVVTVLIILVDLLTLALGKPLVPEFLTSTYRTAGSPPLLLIALLLAAPLLEELFFRGFLFQGIQHTFLGPIGAILVTSAMWSVIHVQYDAYGICIVFTTGIVLGLARLMTESVITSIYLHAFMNLVATIETAIVISLHTA